ncbi:alpha/beta hydrolase [Asticcacaulis sp.]|uniref:alpha/beta hydrolase n=1 Tax=Asticcacaulis sp. TaxID=1872648 RepID=UPI002D04D322|nr:alpha/beta hydrolase [Asticcacaulis sp.]HTM79802.1 alpha/beta hydrolase [Asticcacaulis sp.]
MRKLMQWAAAPVLAVALFTAPAMAAEKPHVRNVVLVHGAWADGSGWQGVYKLLVAKGYKVSVVSNADESLAGDVAATKRVLDRQDGPVILVGHSYGGAIITEAGNDPKVVGLVYIAAFAPDAGESIFGLLPKDGPKPPIEPTADGLAYFNRDAYLTAFAPDVPRAEAEFMADSQVPLGIDKAGSAPITTAAWKTKPSWYLVSSNDQIIPPAAQRQMAGRAKSTVQEVAGSHVAFISHPDAAAALIEQAAEATVK